MVQMEALEHARASKDFKQVIEGADRLIGAADGYLLKMAADAGVDLRARKSWHPSSLGVTCSP